MGVNYTQHLHQAFVKMYFFACFLLLFTVSCNGQSLFTHDFIDKTGLCKTRNGYYKVDGSCDSYYECREYQPQKLSCPDGLNYNPRAKWPEYPCNYPNDAPCIGRGVSQPAKPTGDCPRQYGFFPSPNAAENDCGQYRLCAEGRAYDMLCPFGLAFNMITARCDWPELVSGCNSEAFLGFKCPAAEFDISGNPVVRNFKYESDCFLFYSCQNGRARILSCDPGFAFDPITARCIDADRVTCDAIKHAKKVFWAKAMRN